MWPSTPPRRESSVGSCLVGEPGGSTVGSVLWIVKLESSCGKPAWVRACLAYLAQTHWALECNLRSKNKWGPHQPHWYQSPHSGAWKLQFHGERLSTIESWPSESKIGKGRKEREQVSGLASAYLILCHRPDKGPVVSPFALLPNCSDSKHGLAWGRGSMLRVF